MATIKRASHYFTYLIAVLIAGAFSFFGKTAPTWAEEIQSERSAKVFKETLTVAQATTPQQGQSGSFVDQSIPQPYRPVSADQQAQIFCIGCQDVFGPDGRLSVEKQNSLNQQFGEKFQVIREKVMRDAPLTVEELALLNSVNNSRIIDNLLDQIKIQDRVIENLKSRAK